MSEIRPTSITEELQTSYLDYAMSVIVSRALPDVRDGLKPVQRRILFTMHEMNLTPSGKYRKSSAITGTTLARYHPHGDIPVYEALARMAQDFSLRYPLIDGQGNWGCFTGDTKVQLTDGRKVSFRQLVEEDRKGKTNYTFTFNHRKKKIEIAQIQKPRVTRERADLVEVELDNGEKVRCTPDHRFLLRDGTYKQAQALSAGDSLMPLYRKISDGSEDKMELQGYEMVFQPAGIFYNHKVVAVCNLKRKEDVYDITIGPWHNFALGCGVFVHNSIDGDSPAAQRYTEARLTPLATEMLRDIEKATVDWTSNYDNTRQEPKVLPAAAPQLLLNGAKGIAVGMATNIPPHNLAEVVDGLIMMIDKGQDKVSTEDLLKVIKGPDFPTGAKVYRQDFVKTYSSGRGSFVIRAKTKLQEVKGHQRIVVEELPYQLNKADLIAKIAGLVKEERLSGIRDIIDESDRNGIKVLIELKSGVNAQAVLNQLYKNTALQTRFHLNMIALAEGLQPRLLSLKSVLGLFLDHRFQVVKRRTEYLLKKAQKREHILEGLVKALDNIDAVISTIKKSKHRQAAFNNLKKGFGFTDPQAEAILKMRLQRLANLESQEIRDQLKAVKEEIAGYQKILSSKVNIMAQVKKELIDLKEKYADPRRTEIVGQEIKELSQKDLVLKKRALLTLTRNGRIKRVSPKTYRQQGRGGVGILGEPVEPGDELVQVAQISTHDEIYIFSQDGRVFSLAGYEILRRKRTQKGEFLGTQFAFEQRKAAWAVAKPPKSRAESLALVSRYGKIKRLGLSELQNIKRSGLKVLRVSPEDRLIFAALLEPAVEELLIVSRGSRAIRFKLNQVPNLGRTAQGVKGINLGKQDGVAALLPIKKDQVATASLVTLSEQGFAKQVPLSAFNAQRRGGKGLLAGKISQATGGIATANLSTGAQRELLIATKKGKIIRMALKSVPPRSRRTKGVKAIKLEKGDRVSTSLLL